LRENSV